MRYELLNKYRNEIENGKLDKILLDNYSLDFDKNLYFKINKDCKIIEINNNNSLEEKEWIKERDVLGRYINCNKSIKDKNIMSNNIYSLFFKMEKLLDNSLSNKNVEEKYFNVLIEREINIEKLSMNENIKNSSNIEKQLLKNMTFINQEKCEMIKKTMMFAFNYFYNLYLKDDFKNSKEYKNILTKSIKIFFDTELNNYTTEINKYLTFRLFNKLENCKIIDNEVYGTPSINISHNTRKTFLENKTMDCVYGFYLNSKDILNLYKIDLLLQTFKLKTQNNSEVFARDLNFSNDLENNNLENIINFNKDSYKYNSSNLITDIKKEGYFIKDYNVNSNFDKKKKTLEVINYTQIKDKQNNILPNEKIPFFDFENKLYKFLNPNNLNNELLNKKKLRLNYENIEKFLNTGNSLYLKNSYEKFFQNLLLDIYKNKDINIKLYTMELLNYKFSIKNYLLGGFKLNIEELQNNIISKIKNNIDLKNNEEFLFLYGQIYYYLITKSETKNKNLELLNLPLKSNSVLTLKNDLKRKVQKFGYKIHLNDNKVKTAINLVLRYNFKGQLNMLNNDSLYIGLTYNNLFYLKNENMEEFDNE